MFEEVKGKLKAAGRKEHANVKAGKKRWVYRAHEQK